jgi:hypothetical protein
MKGSKGGRGGHSTTGSGAETDEEEVAQAGGQGRQQAILPNPQCQLALDSRLSLARIELYGAYWYQALPPEPYLAALRGLTLQEHAEETWKCRGDKLGGRAGIRGQADGERQCKGWRRRGNRTTMARQRRRPSHFNTLTTACHVSTHFDLLVLRAMPSGKAKLTA